MPRARSPEERRLLQIAIAKLRGQGRTQAQIATTLRITQGTVSRLLREVTAQTNWLEEMPVFRSDLVDSEELRRAEQRYFSDPAIRDGLNSLNPHNGDLAVHSFENAAFDRSMAQHVSELLALSRCVGVMWGRTIARMVENITRPPGAVARFQRDGFECIPLCGDPLFVMNQSDQEFSASRLAGELELVFMGARGSELPSLSGVPAYLGRATREPFLRDPDETRVADPVRSFVESIPGYRAIFGPPPPDGRPFIEKVDTMVTGVGIIPKGGHAEAGTFIEERLRQEGLTRSELAKRIWGDMGGLLIGRDRSDDAFVRELNEGWMGVQLHHFRRLAERAASGAAPGVVLVAAGAPKAPIVIEAARLGYVNHVLVDQSLAEAIGRRLQSSLD